MNQREVQVYISSNCKECDDLLHFLDKKNVKYISKNTSRNKSYLKEIQEENVYVTPVVKAYGNWILGFQEDQLSDVLGL
ncbi:hypothetical protein SAMN04487944_103251 [Gracilibacillus ureilyticus]|uniref:Glutaredoxin domain-containing protein n=1 Tax=Gracilibacillus ureilyticus TaxID=531814 RepID=A0A1H9NPK9_9BACI|nr:glutaredoxin family protein [Gracilibacillus ureilyticus]SER37920.1 hypothetical protein SAMN04487944_103251 [Gracilibacillus ureilyticus]